MAAGAPPATKPTTPKMAEGGSSGAPQDAAKAPFGGSSATQATPNTGYEAVALQRVGVLTKQIQDMMQLVGAGSEIGKELLKMLNIAVKIAPAGSVTPTSEKNMQMQQQLKSAPSPGAAPMAAKPPMAAA